MHGLTWSVEGTIGQQGQMTVFTAVKVIESIGVTVVFAAQVAVVSGFKKEYVAVVFILRVERVVAVVISRAIGRLRLHFNPLLVNSRIGTNLNTWLRLTRDSVNHIQHVFFVAMRDTSEIRHHIVAVDSYRGIAQGLETEGILSVRLTFQRQRGVGRIEQTVLIKRDHPFFHQRD